MLLCDTSGLIAFFDASDAHHQRVRSVFDDDEGPFVVSPYVLAELDYLVATRRGVEAELAVLHEIAGGAWDLPCFDAAELRQARAFVDRYSDQSIGLADATLVVLTGRYKTDRLLTLDHRHFRVLRTARGRRFTVLP